MGNPSDNPAISDTLDKQPIMRRFIIYALLAYLALVTFVFLMQRQLLYVPSTGET